MRFSSARRPDPARILIVGYFGFGNIGDELILTACLRGLRPLSARLLVLAGPVRGDRAGGARFVSRWNWAGLLGLLLTPGLSVVVPGGEIFQSRSSRRSLRYYAFLCGLFAFFGHRLFLLFQGVPEGSLDRSDRRVVASLFRKAEYVSFRDRIPDFLSNLADGPALPDPVFGLAPDRVRGKDRGLPGERSGRGRFVFVLKDLGVRDKSWRIAVADLVRKILGSDPSARVRLAVFHPADMRLSRWVAAQVSSGRVDVGRADLPGVEDIFGRKDFVFAMRYHALVLALRASARVFALTDEEKLADLCRSAGHREFLDLRSVPSPGRIRGAILGAAAVRRVPPGRSRLSPGLLRARVDRHWADVRARLEGRT